MTMTELIESVVTNGYNVEISHERAGTDPMKRGHVLVRVLTRWNFVEGEAVIDLDDEMADFDTALHDILCRFW